MFLKITELQKLMGTVLHSLHDITGGYNEYDIEISNEIYKLKIKGYWDNIYDKLEGRKIKLKGILDTEKKEIKNSVNIWIKLLKNEEKDDI